MNYRYLILSALMIVFINKNQSQTTISTFPFYENFEGGSSLYFSLQHGTNADIAIDSRAANSSNFGLHFEGGSSDAGWYGYTPNVTPTNAWINSTTHQAKATCTVNASSLSSVFLRIDLKQTYTYGADLSWFRVLVNNTQISDEDAVSNFNPTDNGDLYSCKVFNLSAYAGTTFTLKLQSSCEFYDTYPMYSVNSEGDNVFIDNVAIIGAAPAFDMSLNHWTMPQSLTGLTANENVTVKIKNMGASVQDSILVGYSVNGGSVAGPELITAAIQPDEIYTYTFNIKADFSTTGSYNCKAFIMNTNDQYHYNDTLSENVENMPVFTSNLPLVIMNTYGQPILDEPKITAHVGIIDNGIGNTNYSSDAYNNYNGYVGIEKRGTTSQKYFPKKSYGFETRDSLGENYNVSLLGMPEENDWILYGPFNDKTLMRDVLTYKLYNDLDRYSSKTKYCELFLNGDYHGVFVLLEKIKQDKNRVDISKLDADDLAGDSLTGGYIIKLDKETGVCTDGWTSNYTPSIYFQYHYPDCENIATAQKNYIKTFMNNFETALYGSNFADTSTGYPKYISEGSFIDYMIITELCRNVDGYRLSTYMYKDKDSKDGKLHMGPLWDYNIAYGNCDHWLFESYLTDGWQKDNLGDSYGYVPFWWNRLLEDSVFANRLKCRWLSLRQGALHTDTIMNDIDSLVAYLDEAQQRNFEKWPVLGLDLWFNYYVGTTYQDEVDWLKSWITDRLAWMDDNMPGNCIITNTEDINNIQAFVYPNPFSSDVRINYNLIESGNVIIKIYDILGKEQATLIDKTQNPGNYSITWNGTDINNNKLGKGIYFCSLIVNDRVVYNSKLVKY